MMDLSFQLVMLLVIQTSYPRTWSFFANNGLTNSFRKDRQKCGLPEGNGVGPVEEEKGNKWCKRKIDLSCGKHIIINR